jgi:glycosyltransferase involved in cell wall biosynthesis
MRLADQIVSVVMPVRNAMPFLDEAVASILAQTHGNFEFVIGDDGSTDGSGDRLDQWARRDSRIRLIRNKGNGLGPAGSSNWVVREAIHPLIARMDADDVSRPDRLHRQLMAFHAHPDAVIVGSLSDIIDETGRQIGRRDRSALRDSRGDFPVAHGSIMFRRDAFERVGGYRAICDFWEDRDLLTRMVRDGKALVLPDAMYRYRYSSTGCRLVADEMRIAQALDLRLRCLAAHRNGRDYEEIIEQEATFGPPDTVAPAVLAQIAHERLWRADPRTIMQSWTRRHTILGWNRQSTLIRIFAAWAWLSPASLRACLTFRFRYADWRARNVVADGEVLVWRRETAAGKAGERHTQSDESRAAMEDSLMAAGAAIQQQG